MAISSIEERPWLGQVAQALSDPSFPTVPIECRNLKEAIGERFRWSHRVAELVENSRTYVDVMGEPIQLADMVEHRHQFSKRHAGGPDGENYKENGN